MPSLTRPDPRSEPCAGPVLPRHLLLRRVSPLQAAAHAAPRCRASRSAHQQDLDRTGGGDVDRRDVGSARIIRGNALALPLADESVDLVVTSPPYFGLRSYQDGGQHYDDQ